MQAERPYNKRTTLDQIEDNHKAYLWCSCIGIRHGQPNQGGLIEVEIFEPSPTCYRNTAHQKGTTEYYSKMSIAWNL